MHEDLYKSFAAWLQRIEQLNPPPLDIVAYNFGLCETESGYMVYLVGSRQYDPDDADWACREDYSPPENYLELPPDFTAEKNWQDIQQQVVVLLRKWLQCSEATKMFLKKDTIVTTGFDDGDLERVK